MLSGSIVFCQKTFKLLVNLPFEPCLLNIFHPFLRLPRPKDLKEYS
jgi:hypothetical protein